MKSIQAPHISSLSGDKAQRIVALDGLRGVLALMVLVSHYFGEVPSGFAGLMVAWIAVKMFFVLSGFLMARIILDHLTSENFAPVFYIRRACRTLPVYLVLLTVTFAAATLFSDRAWIESDRILPLWSFLTFTQGILMTVRGDFGFDWLTPSWTLTVEEQFYIIAPFICLLTPRKWLLHVLIGLSLFSIGFRALALETDLAPRAAALVLLPAAMHSMFFGMIAALLLRLPTIDWSRFDFALRAAPIVLLTFAALLKLADGDGDRWFQLLGAPLSSVACAAFLMAIVRDAPEAERLKNNRLRFSRAAFLQHLSFAHAGAWADAWAHSQSEPRYRNLGAIGRNDRSDPGSARLLLVN